LIVLDTQRVKPVSQTLKFRESPAEQLALQDGKIDVAIVTAFSISIPTATVSSRNWRGSSTGEAVFTLPSLSS